MSDQNEEPLYVFRGHTQIANHNEFFGPGLSRYNREFPDDAMGKYYADRILRMLHEAYEAGRQAKAAEFRKVLGIP